MIVLALEKKLIQLFYCTFALFSFLSHFKAQRAELVFRNRGCGCDQVGPGSVSSPCLGDMFFLHLERCQVYWESKYSLLLSLSLWVCN